MAVHSQPLKIARNPYYYPASGGSTTLFSLVNAGSQTAATVGLYHYTTQPLVPPVVDDPATTTIDERQIYKEQGTQADIGLHPV